MFVDMFRYPFTYIRGSSGVTYLCVFSFRHADVGKLTQQATRHMDASLECTSVKLGIACSCCKAGAEGPG